MKHERRDAQTLAEFAIVLPFLLLMLGIIVDFGFYIYDYLSTHAAVRDAAAAAMQTGSGSFPGAKPTQRFNSDSLLKIIQNTHGPVSPILSTEVSIQYCCLSSGSSTSTFSSVTRPDTSWGNADRSSTFTSEDDFVGVDILVQHAHKFLLPVYWAGAGTITIKSRAKIFMVPGFSP